MLSKEEAPEMLGKFISVGALASLFTYGAIWVSLEQLKLDFKTVYLMAGGLGFVLILVMAFASHNLRQKCLRTRSSSCVNVTGYTMRLRL